MKAVAIIYLVAALEITIGICYMNMTINNLVKESVSARSMEV